MSHQCRIEASSAECFESNGELWVKEFAYRNEKEGRTYKVNFCPECGYKLPKRETFLRFFSRPEEPDESISKFSHDLSKAISEMNHNIELIKAFMISQNTQNDCFIRNEMELRKRISNLEKTSKDDDLVGVRA